jgi:hypothetical protein
MTINSLKAALIIYFIFYFSSCKNNNENGNDEMPVFAVQVAPIIYKNCTPCHRPGSGAPFNLITYDDLKRHLHTVQLSIDEGLMPPWPADTSYSHFRGEKILSHDEINTLKKWIKIGAPPGDLSNVPPPPVFYNESRFGKPDMVIRLRKPFLIPGDNRDHFIMVKIPFDLPADTFIRAIEIVPGNKKLVHHINAHLVQYQENEKKDNSSGVPFVDTEKYDKQTAYAMLGLANDDGTYPLLTPSVTNYLPGVETSFYPEGIGGLRAKKRCALLLDNIHYGPSAIDTSDQTSFNIFFDSHPPQRPLKEFILGTSGISPVVPALVIPADSVKSFKTSYLVPEDISLLTVNPHMHLLGASFIAYFITPAGDTIPLIRIPKWDFRWQYFYTFRMMKKIPVGSVIVAEGVYDNTEENPLIPFHPPRTIFEREGSMRTTDEMFQFICTYLPYKSGDENTSLEIK